MAMPMSDFARQVNHDNPSLTIGEAKVVADCIFRSADLVADQPLARPVKGKRIGDDKSRAKFPRSEDATQLALLSSGAASSSNSFPAPSVDLGIHQDNQVSLVSPPGLPGLSNMAGLPIVPYRFRPLHDHVMPDDNSTAKKKQKVAFSGAPIDQDDEQWYDDDRLPIEAVSPALPPLQSEEQVVPTIPPTEVVSHRRKRRPRKLARFDSAEASALFSNNHDFGASSNEDST